MNTKSALPIVLVLAIVALGGFLAYNFTSQSPDTRSPSGPAETPENETGEVVALRTHATLGKYMTDQNGITLYTFAKDLELRVTCVEECAKIWPPFLAGEEARANLNSYSHPLDKFLNLIPREDGLVQFAFGNSPLYYYSGDKKVGDVNGQGVNNVWFIAQPDIL